MLRVGLPALCIIAALCGAFLGGASRYFYKQFQTWNKLRKRKAALFGNGWFDSDRYIGPNHHTVVVKKKESKKKIFRDFFSGIKNEYLIQGKWFLYFSDILNLIDLIFLKTKLFLLCAILHAEEVV